MNADRLTTQLLLSSKVQYRMPLFQRPQSWSIRDRTILWEDLLSVYDRWGNPDQGADPRAHFLGAIVIQQLPGQPLVHQYLVIDGQQRLTNLWVILAVIRDGAKKDPNDWGTLDEEIQNLYITNQYEPPDKRQKLLLGSLDKAHLEQIADRQIPDPGSTLGKIYNDYRRKLRKADKDYGGLDLKKLTECVLGGMSVVSIVMQTEENPYQIFESLNAKGRRLTKGDLVRNYIMMRIEDSYQEGLHAQYWLPMEQAVMQNDKENDDSLTEFFARYLTVKSGSRVIEKNAYDAMRSRYETNKENAETTQDLIRDLHGHHRYFCQVKNKAGHSDKNVGRRLKYLADWKVDLADPFIMTVLQLQHDDQISVSDLQETLAMLEALLVRRFICQMPPRELGDPFARMAHDPDLGSIGLPAWFGKEIAARNLSPDAAVFSKSFTDYRSSNSKRSRTKLILIGLEQSFENNEAPETKDAQLEHLMPQTLTDEWKNHLGADYQEIYDMLLESFGNLSITKSNQNLSNKPFAEKKDILKDSNYELNKKVMEYENWNRDSILDRESILVDMATTTWPL